MREVDAPTVPTDRFINEQGPVLEAFEASVRELERTNGMGRSAELRPQPERDRELDEVRIAQQTAYRGLLRAAQLLPVSDRLRAQEERARQEAGELRALQGEILGLDDDMLALKERLVGDISARTGDFFTDDEIRGGAAREVLRLMGRETALIHDMRRLGQIAALAAGLPEAKYLSDDIVQSLRAEVANEQAQSVALSVPPVAEAGQRERSEFGERQQAAATVFSANPGQFFTREQLAQAVLGRADTVALATISVMMRRALSGKSSRRLQRVLDDAHLELQEQRIEIVDEQTGEPTGRTRLAYGAVVKQSPNA